MTDGEKEIYYRIAFSRLRGMTVVLGREILGRVGGEEHFFSLTETQLGAVMGCRNKLFSESVRQNCLTEADREYSFVKAAGIAVRYFNDPESGYPALLSECDDAPVALYTLGALDINSCQPIAVVGTRHATNYGTNYTSRMVGEIAATVADKVAVVSGLAYGIDVAAHNACLENGVATVAVLANPLNTIYPAIHRGIAAKIVANGGLLITEYGITDAVHKGNFLARNRLVAGMSRATVVVESDVKGGAMTTARLATEYGRDVYALPGRLNDKYSTGCNQLIHNNTAGIIHDIPEFVNGLGLKMRTVEGLQQELFKELDETEQAIIDHLTKKGESSLHDLHILLNIPTYKLSSTLIDMEFRGLVSALPGARYTLG